MDDCIRCARRRLLQGVIVVGSAVVWSASALSANPSQYELYYGNVNGDGYPDIYFQIQQSIVLIHSDIAIPIAFYPSSSFVIYGGSGGYGSPQLLDLTDADLATYTKAQLNSDYYLGDLNGDGIQDVLIRGQNESSTSLVVSGSSGDLLPSTLVSFTGANALSHNLSDRSISIGLSDYNDDNRIDIVLANQGSAYQFTSGSSFAEIGPASSVSYQYDALGRLRVISETSASTPYTQSYRYDPAGNRCEEANNASMGEGTCDAE